MGELVLEQVGTPFSELGLGRRPVAVGLVGGNASEPVELVGLPGSGYEGQPGFDAAASAAVYAISRGWSP